MNLVAIGEQAAGAGATKWQNTEPAATIASRYALYQKECGSKRRQCLARASVLSDVEFVTNVDLLDPPSTKREGSTCHQC